jgi:hypothetical protein
LDSVQVDNIGKESMEEGKYLYRNKDTDDIYPLSMVDDMICLSETGYKVTFFVKLLRGKLRLRIVTQNFIYNMQNIQLCRNKSIGVHPVIFCIYIS